MNRAPMYAIPLAVVAALAACERQAPPAAAPAAPAADAATTAAPPTPAPAPAAEPPTATPASPVTFSGDASDQRAFAGHFAAGRTRIDLMGDGTFKLQDASGSYEGTWTAEQNGSRIRLDAHSKTAPDRLYGVADRDELRALDDDTGEPTRGALALRRKPAK